MIVDSKGDDVRRVPADIVQKFRTMVCSYAEKNLNKSAVFWADKVVAFSGGSPEDVFLFARTLFADGQYARAAELILSRKLHLENDAFRCLAADALRRCKNLSRAEAIIMAVGEDDVTAPNIGHDRSSRLTSTSRLKSNSSVNSNSVLASAGSTTSSAPVNVASRIMMQQSLTKSWSPSVGKRILASTPKDQATPASKLTPVNVSGPANKFIPMANFAGFEDIWTNMAASNALIKAQIAEANENRKGAAEYYKDALIADPFCQEAFQALVKSHMLSPSEEAELLQAIPWATAMTPLEADLLKSLYSLAMKRVDARENPPPIPEVFSSALEKNSDVLLWKAKHLYNDCDYIFALKLIRRILSADRFHPDVMTMYIACLMEAKEVDELFRVAHDLVDDMPEESLTWYAVGCYYYLSEKLEPSRRYLMKATTMDKFNGVAWIMFGHAYAVDAEHDRSMAAYYKAQQIMRGSHLPLLYVGLGYENSKTYDLAKDFFTNALKISPNDPFVLHELGVVCFYEKRYSDADKYFRSALAQVDRENRATPYPEKWEPLLNNLGHVCRKMKKYDEAILFHQRALRVKPKTASTYAAMGFIMAWKGELWQAASFLHQALALRRDDSLSNELLNYVLETLSQREEEAFLKGTIAAAPDDLEQVTQGFPKKPEKHKVTSKMKKEQANFKQYALGSHSTDSEKCGKHFSEKVSSLVPKPSKKDPSASRMKLPVPIPPKDDVSMDIDASVEMETT